AAAEGQELELRGSALDCPRATSPLGSALLDAAPPSSRTVLVAEDDPDVALRLAAALRDDGVRCVHVTELGAALAAARRAPPSLLLLDLAVPRSEVLAACRQVRDAADPRLREIPVLVVAGGAPAQRAGREGLQARPTRHPTRPPSPP